MKKYILLTLFVTNSFAVTSFPRGCEENSFHFDERQLVINPFAEQSLYYFKNISSTPVEIKSVKKKKSFLSVQFNTTLNPKHWAALATDMKNMTFKCRSNNAEVKCKTRLSLCHYPRVRFSDSNVGNYWVSTNKSLKKIMLDSINMGILLSW